MHTASTAQLQIKSEQSYSSTQQGLSHKLSITVNKIMELDPSLILGRSKLLQYDAAQGQIVLSPTFQNLLKLLVELDELDSSALTASTLFDLNTILQKNQGVHGGLKREDSKERWELKDNPTKQQHRKTFDDLLTKLGFVDPQLINEKIVVDHGIIFGALAQRMETRVQETVHYLNSNLEVKKHLFLLGSTRKLTSSEIEHLKTRLNNLHEEAQTYWLEVFNTQEHATEANALACLWQCLVPEETKVALQCQVIAIKSTRIGASYNGSEGHRVTTEITAEDWLPYYNNINEPQAIFALAEQPYVRLHDQLKLTTVSNGKKAEIDELIKRIKNTTFYFGSPEPSQSPLLSVIFDEIARNVYRTVDTLNYLDKLK